MSNLTDDHLTKPVVTIRVTMHTTGPFFESDTRSGNHASIFLVTGNEESVRLNMTKAGPTHTMGTYTETYHRYAISASALHNSDIRAAEGLTVEHVILHVREKRLDKYRLAPSGVGCRFWVKSVVESLDSNGYIHPSTQVSAADAGNRLQYITQGTKAPNSKKLFPARLYNQSMELEDGRSSPASQHPTLNFQLLWK